MSVEALTIARLVEEGAPGLRKLYQAGCSADDFAVYEEEFRWVEDRLANRLSVSPRVFRQVFEDFEFAIPDEKLEDLLHDLKAEKAFMDMRALVDTLATTLDTTNAIEKAMSARDMLTEIARQHAPNSDFALIGGWRDHLKEQKQKRILRQAGVPAGIQTGFKHIDFHWDGLVPGRMIVVLGRPGEGKSYLVGKFAAHAIYGLNRVLFFSPEMNKSEHLCRIHTLLSAYPDVKAACGLEHSFRNRALMSGVGYSMKKYTKFMEYLEAEMGEIVLMTATNRRMKMTVPFIETKIADMQPDLVIIDPIYKLAASKARKSRIEELSDIADGIQDLAEQYNIPILVTNQAHRQQTKKDDAPDKDASFNSDVPIQEADHVIGVKNASEEHLLMCRCTKSRFGHDFRFDSKFYPNTGVLKELGEPQGSYYNGNDDIDEDELEAVVNRAVTSKRKVTKK